MKVSEPSQQEAKIKERVDRWGALIMRRSATPDKTLDASAIKVITKNCFAKFFGEKYDLIEQPLTHTLQECIKGIEEIKNPIT